MGDARAVVQMRKRQQDDQEQAKTPEADAGPAAPPGAMGDPSGALAAMAGGIASTMLASLQAAGGNSAVQAELDGLNEGVAGMHAAKAEKDAFQQMTDGQKLNYYAEKHGGQLPQGGQQAPPEGTPPAGASSPGEVAASHMARSGQLTALATAYSQVGATAGAAAATAGMDSTTQGALAALGAHASGLAGECMGLAGAYMQVAGDIMATQNEFAFAATAPVTVAAVHEERLAQLGEQKMALDQLAGAYADFAAQQEAAAAEKEAEAQAAEAEVAAA
ncbi:MAG: hypothetical protein KC635_15080, partial [Myxococcales bacterium]|nr:hypothetical protein [Myxococcales bacterium]